MDRRSFLKKAPLAAVALALPSGVQRLVEGTPPAQATVLRGGDPLAPHPPFREKQRWELGWKAQIGKDQYGAVLITDVDVPAEAIAEVMNRQLAETIVEVVGNRRALAIARRIKA